MSFFIRKTRNQSKSTPNKRKGQNQTTNRKNEGKAGGAGRKASLNKKSLNEEISSGSSDEDDDQRQDIAYDNDNTAAAAARRKRKLKDLAAAGDDGQKKGSGDEDDSDADAETPQEKRLRLAKKYLESIETEERLKNDGLDDGDVDYQRQVGDRLRDDILEETGRLHRKVADNYTAADTNAIRCLRNGHQLAVTAVVVTSDEKYVFSVSKDCSIVKWEFESGRRVRTIPGLKSKKAKSKSKTKTPNGTTAKTAGKQQPEVGHSAHILALAITSDDKFLATGCVNKIINIWAPESMTLLKTFRGHRGAVSGLAFRKGFHQLFSASFDRSVKVWNLDEMSYVETLFGHSDQIQAIDSYMRDRAITVGARDASARIWKIPEESQLVFHGSQHSIDCVKLLDEQHFITADDNGSISLWGVLKKKPLSTYAAAHGLGSSAPNWVTALAVMRNTDLIASGSSDGLIRLWKCSQDFRKLEPIVNIPVVGFVNSLEFSPNGKCLVVGVGKEHRLGRWFTIKEAKNNVLIIPLIIK